MYKKSSCLALMAMAALHSTAHAMPPRPTSCPNFANIKAAGLSYAAPGKEGYTVAQFDEYGTNDRWLFGFTYIKAKSSQSALGIGYQYLDTLFGKPEPMAITSENVWACLYKTQQGPYGIALTPVNTSAPTMQALNTIMR